MHQECFRAISDFQRRGPIWWLCGGIMCQIYQIYLCSVYIIQENKWDWRKYISTIWWLCVVGSCVNEGLCDLLIWPAVWFTAYWKVTPIPPYQLQQISHLDIPLRYPTSISNLDIQPLIISHLGQKRTWRVLIKQCIVQISCSLILI